MSHFDLRYAIPIIIYWLIKPQSASALLTSWIWDPSDTKFNHYGTTWITLALVLLLLILLLTFFLFISAELSLARPSLLVRFHLDNFSALLAVSLVASLTLPHPIFLYAYPIMLLIFATSRFRMSLFYGQIRLLMRWLHEELFSALQISQLVRSAVDEDHHAVIEIQLPLPQVAMDVFPDDDDPDADD